MLSSKPRGLHARRFFDTEKPIMSIASKDLVLVSDSSTIATVTEIMLHRFRRIPVVSQGMRLAGIVGITDVLDFLGGGEKFNLYNSRTFGMKMPVRHIKTDRVHTIDAGSSILKALEMFRYSGKGAFPVIEGGVLKGMISESDIVNRIAAPVDVRVSDIMTHRPIVAKKDYSVWDAAKMMCRGGFRRLPVTDDGIVIGVVAPYDILSYLARGERVTKRKLEALDVRDVMNEAVIAIGPEATVSGALDLMRSKHVGGLPVTEDHELVGIITERDILNALVI
jgi:predicted transcriptional regulator